MSFTYRKELTTESGILFSQFEEQPFIRVNDGKEIPWPEFSFSDYPSVTDNEKQIIEEWFLVK